METEERTLWGILHNEYFKIRLTIRSDQTRDQYRFAVKNLTEMLGRPPTISDLTDDTLAALANHLLDSELAEITVNERVGRLKTLWTWLAKRGRLPHFPTLARIPQPERVPKAWTAEELQRLFGAFSRQGGYILGIRAADWWMAFHAWLWNTGERRGASLLLRWDMLELKKRTAVLPASIRKGRRKAAVYHLWPDTCELLKLIRRPERELVFPWPYHLVTYYHHYSRILKQAGLPDGRYSKTQCMRVSHATWLHALGVDATAALGHSSPETTRRSYLDVRLLAPVEKPLFKPWVKA